MQLMTKSLRQQFPPLYATEETPIREKRVVTSYFMPWGAWYWYPIEFDGTDLFFGLVVGYEAEFGYFRLSELKSSRDLAGDPAIVRDHLFQAKSVAQVIEEVRIKRPDILWTT